MNVLRATFALLAFAVAIAAAPVSASPSDRGPWLIASLASPQMNDAPASEASRPAWTLGAGTDLTGWLAAEMAYSDLGERTTDTPLARDFTIRATTIALSPYTHVGPVRVFGRLGAAYWEVGSSGRSTDGWGSTFGAGAEVALARGVADWRLRAEWARLADVDTGLDDSDVDVLSAGLTVRY